MSSQLRSLVGIAGLCLITAAPAFLFALLGEFNDPIDRVIVLAVAALSLGALAAVAFIHWRTGWLLSTAAAMFAIPHAAFIVIYRWPIDANALALIPETNVPDAFEMISGVPIVASAALFAPILLAALAWQPPLLDRRFGIRLFCYTCVSLAMIFFSVMASSAQALTGEEVFPSAGIGQAKAWRGAFPIGSLWVISDTVRERAALGRAIRRPRAPFGIARANPLDRRRLYLMVIGEASRGDHWQINGYARPTTPNLAARNDVISFSRMYSPWAFSRLAVPLLLTRKPSDSTAALFAESSIISVFREAGYQTAWISTKPAFGFHSSPVTIHAREAAKTIYLNVVDTHGRGKLDESILPAVKRLIAATESDLFVVIHTMGSHFRYSDRYRGIQPKFVPDRPQHRSVKIFQRSDRAYLINSYDNSVRYTDRFLGELIALLQAEGNSESWLYYASDHGEALFDDCRSHSGHGYLDYATQSTAAFFWASHHYRMRRPEMVSMLVENQHKPLGISMTFETLSDLAGVTVPRSRVGNSIARKNPVSPPYALAAELDLMSACSSHSPTTKIIRSDS